MIYTGYYAKLKEYEQKGLTPIAISGKPPKWFPQEHRHWKQLAPSWDIYSKWKNGEIDDQQYTLRFISERLEMLDKQHLLRILLALDNPILLCYEKEDFCHRHIVAKWIKDNLKLNVEEFHVD